MNILLPLTNAAGDWIGTALGDTHYLRVKVNPPIQLKPGKYRFVLQHLMKEQKLSDILSVGMAIDK